MGKKDKNKKKGKGAEKTAAKTDKKISNKQKKALAAIGEDDIEKIIADIEHEEQRRQQVVEHVVQPPSHRSNFTFTANPEKDELILFGGEFFNGQKTALYNDLFFYNIPRNEWLLVKAPNGPPPRCGHQAVALPVNKGQLWVFGGEYASPTQSQFYHYKDLWVYHMVSKKWEKITAAGGPSARSGHRMVASKKQLIVFGGFHDNLRDYKYFNDLYAFDLTNYTWKKLEPSGTPPSPRSGCVMAALSNGKILVYGGYSKERIKKDVDKGKVHTDMFLLVPDKNDSTGTKWKWTSVKHSGVHLSPRCGMTLAVAPGDKAYTFGGVWDEEETEEELSGTFFNDLHVLDLDKTVWRNVNLTGKKDGSKLKRRRKKDKDGEDGEDANGDDDQTEEEMEVSPDRQVTDIEKETSKISLVSDDGVFQLSVGPTSASSTSGDPSAGGEASSNTPIFQPSPRINCGLVVKNGILYLYGGLVEVEDKELTLADFYSLNLHRLDEWQTIIASDLDKQEWLDSESSDNDDEEDDDESEGTDEDTNSEDEEDKMETE